MKNLLSILILSLALNVAYGQTTKPDTNKYYFPFTRPQLEYLTKQIMKTDSVLINSDLKSKDSYPVIQFLNDLQAAFLQNYKIQLAEMDKKKNPVKPTK